MNKIVGIDLGTTFSSIAIVNKYGQPEIITNQAGERLTPSVVLFDGETPIVGSIAKRSAVANSLNIVGFVKRHMGNPNYKFRTEGGTIYSPEEISAIILKRLKEDAEIRLGYKINDAVITVPAYFDDGRRKATHDAGRIAGFNVRRIINEPTAAALAYGFDKSGVKHTLLVYDLGGGTFDVTIMEIGPGKLKVIATGGDRNLGGFNWDNEIMTYLNNEFQKNGGPDLSSDPSWQQELRNKAEIAKITLSSRDKTSVFFSIGGIDISIPFMRTQFEEFTNPLLNRTANIMESVLEDAHLNWKNINKVLLVGGSTRMKAVPELIERITGMKPSLEVNPDEAVSLGAAIQAALIQIEDGHSNIVEQSTFPLVEIKDVTAYSLGVIALNEFEKEVNSIVLNKNTQIPCKVSDIFYTVEDDQQELDVRITVGEDIDINGNIDIAARSMIKISPYRKGAPVEVFFEYNIDGMIQVTVYDVTAKKNLGEITIKRTRNMDEKTVLEKTEKMRTLSIS